MDDEKKIEPLKHDTMALDIFNNMRRAIDDSIALMANTRSTQEQPGQHINIWSDAYRGPFDDNAKQPGVDSIVPADDYIFENGSAYNADFSAEDTAGCFLTFAAPQPITAHANNDLVVEIKYTGEVTLGKDVSAEHAAHEFWTRLADLGGHFEERMQALDDELVLVEHDLDDEQSMRLELEETLNEVCAALGVPSGHEDDVVDFVKKFKEEYDSGMKLIQELRGESKPVEIIETAETAYKRAMKSVR